MTLQQQLDEVFFDTLEASNSAESFEEALEIIEQGRIKTELLMADQKLKTA